MQAEEPQPNHNVTPKHIEPEQTTHEITQQIGHKLLRMDVLTSKTCLALNNELKKASDINLVSLYSTVNHIYIYIYIIYIYIIYAHTLR